MHSIYLLSECRDYYCLCLDRDHVDYAKRFYKDVKDAFFPITNNYLRSYTREEAVRFMAQSKGRIHLFGTGWDTLDDLGDVVLHGSCTYLETAAIYKRSKIVFNVMPYFKNGAHDRIPTSMLAGAAVLTDESKYYRDICEKAGHEIMRFWDLYAPEALPDIVDNMLSDTAMLYELAQSGLHFARENMTWGKTAKKLVEILEKVL